MNEASNFDEKAILRQALDLPVDDLYAEIGQLAYDGAMPASFSEMVEEGKRWVTGRRADLKAAICPHHKAFSLSLESGDKLFAAAGAAQILGSLEPGTSKFLFAALLVKLGIDVFCDGGE
jgi:hypothetical protein